MEHRATQLEAYTDIVNSGMTSSAIPFALLKIAPCNVLSIVLQR
jgi:hypothetical protein